MSGGERLQKVLARAGIASRRHAETLIEAGRVTVNGLPVTALGTRVDPAYDDVAVDGHRVQRPAVNRYLALNKPRGYVTTVSDPEGRPTVMDLVPTIPGLFPAGRLDVDSTGLLLLTTDGDWAQLITHPRHGSEKEYLVSVRGAVTADVIRTLEGPMVLAPGERTTGAQVALLSSDGHTTMLRVVLHEGRNRQIRRMMAAVGHSVTRLHRNRVGAVLLGDLPEGRWRDLSVDEVVAMQKAPAVSYRGPAVRLRRRPA